MGRATAYDLSQFAPQTERPRVRVVKTDHTRTKKKKVFKVRFITCVAALSLLMAGTVYSRLQLTQVRQQTIAANQKLTEVTSENAYLDYELESMVSLGNAEKYARDELGLVKLETSQIEYVTLNDENKIETGEDTPSGLSEWIDRILDFLFGERE